jgi:hypothetical protein
MVELKDNNRFAGGTIKTFADGTQILVAPDIATPIAKIKDFNLTTVKARQDITAISYGQYNKTVSDASKYYWLLCEANNIKKPWELENLEGEELVVPDIIQFKLNR